MPRVRGLAARQVEGDDIAGGVRFRVDFRGEAAARASERLAFLPPFAPAADTGARTIVESNIWIRCADELIEASASKKASKTPALLSRSKRFHTLFQGPKRSGRALFWRSGLVLSHQTIFPHARPDGTPVTLLFATTYSVTVPPMQRIANYIAHVPVAVEPSDDGIGSRSPPLRRCAAFRRRSDRPSARRRVLRHRHRAERRSRRVRLQHAGGARSHGVAAPLPPLQSTVHQLAEDAAMLRRMSSVRQA